MGMAASQARLLSLTSRLHDIELKAQSIEAQKIALATQKDELYENYNAALDATKFQVAFMGNGVATSWENASFKNLCTYVGTDRYHDYALKDARTGLLIESKEVVENYNMFSNDKYAFAWAMLGYIGNNAKDDSWAKVEGSRNAKNAANTENYLNRQTGDGGNPVMSATEWEIYENLTGNDKSTLEDLYKKIEEADAEGDVEERSKAIAAFREKFYNTAAVRDALLESDSFNAENPNTTWDDIVDEFNYYCRKFEAIKQAGGCTEIEPQFESGSEGEIWLKNMVEAGLIIIQEDKNTQGANSKWQDTSVATSTNQNYLKEFEDTKNQKKAEAEYEHELSIINRKDTKFDNDLNKLETERTAITTEIDSIKQVRDDNIDRTFGIFS